MVGDENGDDRYHCEILQSKDYPFCHFKYALVLYKEEDIVQQDGSVQGVLCVVVDLLLHRDEGDHGGELEVVEEVQPLDPFVLFGLLDTLVADQFEDDPKDQQAKRCYR